MPLFSLLDAADEVVALASKMRVQGRRVYEYGTQGCESARPVRAVLDDAGSLENRQDLDGLAIQNAAEGAANLVARRDELRERCKAHRRREDSRGRNRRWTGLVEVPLSREADRLRKRAQRAIASPLPLEAAEHFGVVSGLVPILPDEDSGETLASVGRQVVTWEHELIFQSLPRELDQASRGARALAALIRYADRPTLNLLRRYFADDRRWLTDKLNELARLGVLWQRGRLLQIQSQPEGSHWQRLRAS